MKHSYKHQVLASLALSCPDQTLKVILFEAAKRVYLKDVIGGRVGAYERGL